LDGIAPLRQSIARKLEEFNGIEADPDREVLVTSGATGAFFAACTALLNPGDEVIIFEPFYSYHVNTIAALRAFPVYVRLTTPDWEIDREAVERAVTARTKAIVINSPANPCGKVFTRTELDWLADFAERHDLFVFSDEIYEYFLFDERQHVSPATIPGMRERTITISGFSKTFSVTGWRLGYLHCSERWRQAIAYFHDLSYVCAPAPLQMGVLAGLEQLGESFYRQLAADYAHKRDMLCSALIQAGLTPSIPQGAYYVLADASGVPGATSKERAMMLLERARVAAVPGAAFFHDDSGERLLRFCFAKTEADLAEACNRLASLNVAGAVGA
jgi:aminotransferase